MMKVKMKEDKKGSPDGANVIDYIKGKTYNLPDALAQAWIGRKLAVAVKSPEPEGQPESKKNKEVKK